MSSPAPWAAKRVATLLLTLGLVALAAYSLARGILGTLPVLAIGIILGGLYVWRGGSLPEWAYRIRNKAGLRSITRDDDEANLPIGLYLPILIGALLLAAMIFAVFLRR